MNAPVSLDELLSACEWVSAGDAAALYCVAYVARATGKVYWCGEGAEEQPPEDIDDENLYIAVPHKTEFDLGRSLVLRFVEAHLPDERETVNEFFRKRGAYAQFKSLLARTGQLETWHEYEHTATEAALREWCEENGLCLVP